MGAGIETVVGYLSNAATATAQALTAASPQTFTVRSTNGSSIAHLEALWGSLQDPGYLRVHSPRLHDNVNGILAEGNGTNVNPLLFECFSQNLYSQDTLTFEALFTAAPTATHTTLGAMMIYYDDIQGIAGNFKSWAEVQPMIQSYMGVEVVPTSSATAGQWGNGVALNSSQDNFKANGMYALLGYNTPTSFLAWSILGTDLGNLMVGGPGSTEPIMTRQWFPMLSMNTGYASIPVINAQNKASSLVQCISATASTAYPLSLFFAYLGQGSGS
jgi:hypothetical protein